VNLIEDKFIYQTDQKEYFKYDLSQRIITQINLEEYCKILFGRYNYKLRNLLDNTISIEANKIYAAFYQNTDLWIHDRAGELLERKKNFFQGFTPYEIQTSKERDEIWVATGAGQAVLCFDLTTGKEKKVIGIPYEDKSELSFPESICIFKDNLYISEMGNRKITKVSLENKEMSDYLNFEEPVWNFLKNNLLEIVYLDSGIYEIKNGQKNKIGK